MSSSRLTKLRNRAAAENAPPPNRNMQQQQPRQQQQQQQQQQGNVNPMQILQWHETRLKDLLQRFEYLDAKTESLAEMNLDAQKSNNSNNSNDDANNLIVVNDILDRINKLSQRVDAIEVLTRNLKDDYLTYKNGSTENKVELIVNDKGNS